MQTSGPDTYAFGLRLQWTGINTIIFYAPQLFITLGASQSAALAATIVTGVVNHIATYVSLWAADEFGRRVLFIEGGVQMTLALVSWIPAQKPYCTSLLTTVQVVAISLFIATGCGLRNVLLLIFLRFRETYICRAMCPVAT